MGVRKQLRAMQWSWGKLAILASWGVIGGLSFYLGRVAFVSEAVAAPNNPVVRPQDNAPKPTIANGSQVLAYIHDNIPITRDDLAEYLIARQGAERLPLLINRRIIELACQKAGVTVTSAEIEETLNIDLKALNSDQKTFAATILKQFHKTLYEWKEDVVRPRLMLTKLCRTRVTVTEQDMLDAYEANFGEKVEGRIILWPRSEAHLAQKAYGELRSSEEKFAETARLQATPSLASTGGKVKPLGRHSTGSPELEKAIMSLKEGQLSELVDTPEGVVVFKCDKRIPPVPNAPPLADLREKMQEMIMNRKTNAEFHKYFEELRASANVVNLMTPDKKTQADLEREVLQFIKEGNGTTPKSPTPLRGN